MLSQYSGVTVDRPVEVCYRQWRDFKVFSRISRLVKRVEHVREQIWRWVLQGPLGNEVDWELELVRDIPNYLIEFRSLPGADIILRTSVRFEDLGDGRTHIFTECHFEPPDCLLGDLLLDSLVSTQEELDQAHRDFKRHVESLSPPDDIARRQGATRRRAERSGAEKVSSGTASPAGKSSNMYRS